MSKKLVLRPAESSRSHKGGRGESWKLVNPLCFGSRHGSHGSSLFHQSKPCSPGRTPVKMDAQPGIVEKGIVERSGVALHALRSSLAWGIRPRPVNVSNVERLMPSRPSTRTGFIVA
jgi:hypothetical protein